MSDALCTRRGFCLGSSSSRALAIPASRFSELADLRGDGQPSQAVLSMRNRVAGQAGNAAVILYSSNELI